jgi:hypothetical protein
MCRPAVSPPETAAPTLAPPPSMVGCPPTLPHRLSRASSSSPPPYKGPLEPLLLLHRTPPLLHLCSAAAAEAVRRRPPLVADLLLRLSFRVSELWVRFLVLLASFLFLSHRVWCLETRIRVVPASSSSAAGRPPPPAGRCRPICIQRLRSPKAPGQQIK